MICEVFGLTGGKRQYSNLAWMLGILPSDPVRAFFLGTGNSLCACADQHSAAYCAVFWSCLSVQLPLPSSLCFSFFGLCFVSSTHGVCELCQGLLFVLWPGNSLGNDVCFLTLRDNFLCVLFHIVCQFFPPGSFRWEAKSCSCYSILAI